MSERLARFRGLDARTLLLFVLLLGEGVGLLWLAKTQTVAMAVAAMITVGRTNSASERSTNRPFANASSRRPRPS